MAAQLLAEAPAHYGISTWSSFCLGRQARRCYRDFVTIFASQAK
jgi:hypothetical protein